MPSPLPPSSWSPFHTSTPSLCVSLHLPTACRASRFSLSHPVLSTTFSLSFSHVINGCPHAPLLHHHYDAAAPTTITHSSHPPPLHHHHTPTPTTTIIHTHSLPHSTRRLSSLPASAFPPSSPRFLVPSQANASLRSVAAGVVLLFDGIVGQIGAIETDTQAWRTPTERVATATSAELQRLPALLSAACWEPQMKYSASSEWRAAQLSALNQMWDSKSLLSGVLRDLRSHVRSFSHLLFRLSLQPTCSINLPKDSPNTSIILPRTISTSQWYIKT